ncbi:MAG TPA: type II CAAX endopeptidase family protein [Candidatus Polarisedimenticolia bacterium]|nr:type II CAAX endopeptidase family protein [Candidatus Polarisedimenticolia bacterium]
MTFSDPENPLPPDDSPGDSQTPASQIPESFVPPETYLSPQHREDLNFPEDIRTPWGGTELLIFVGFAIVSLVVLEVLLQIFLLVGLHMSRRQILRFLTTSAAYAVGFQALWSCILLLFLFVIIRKYHSAPFWTSLGWRTLRFRTVPASTVYLICIFGGITLAMLGAFISHFAGSKTNLPIQEYFHSRANIIWLMVFGIGFAPFFEETLFRGYLYPVFARKWGIPAGVIITGVLFGMTHALQLWGGWLEITMLIFVGIVLTFIRAAARSVLASYLVHVSYNSFLFLGFFIGTQGLKHIPPLH